MTRVMIMAGGTGGHVFPALAVAAELRARGAEVFWLGTRRGLEAKLVPAAGIPMEWISVAGIRGKGGLALLLAPFQIMRAAAQVLAVIFRQRPTVVLGMGGFVTGPGGVVTWLLRKPLVIHEQNSIAGMTNRLLAPLAQRVCAAFPDTFNQISFFHLPLSRKRERDGVRAFDHEPRTRGERSEGGVGVKAAGRTAAQKVLHTGNPVRREIAELPAPEQRFAARGGAINLLVLGGSLGARALNETVPAAMALMTTRPTVRHQTGGRHLDEARAAYQNAGVTARIEPFIDDMAAAYAWADLVVCRAGALTVAELAAAGVGALLVPYPHAVDDHQTHNAHYLVQAQAALVVQQRDLTPARLVELLTPYCEDATARPRLLAMAQAARRLARTDAAALVAEQCLEVAHG
ncbi:MAG: UDP-N-acetylglucosamine--N-acetylmuramyl-(pentapeptide) pyrophosphoryl-undecaprenol N-acetylglucosamine transferase [Pseudomonadota bacterium]